MKTFKNLCLLLIMAMAAISCDEIDELTEFDVEQDFNTSFIITVGEEDPLSFSQTQTINISSNAEIQDNLDRLERVRLDRLTYEIDNYSGAAGILADAAISFGSTTISVTGIDLQQSDIDNEVYDIGNSTELNAIASALRNALVNNNTFTGTVTGTVSGAPVTFNVKVKLEVTVTVDAL